MYSIDGDIADDPNYTPNDHNFYISRYLSYIFLAGNRRDFKFGVLVEHSMSMPTDDKPSLKGA